ncbi:hypothetical protein BDZ94DRAFT_1299452 [Collybia nuda]|uniref:Protein kinase domain-containing protein n=1 Tax=Collybia nuda TaxID=64659 RepID=A0A9P5Y0B2_9AGAR|nr:hypothetical protein BDZ94DRAFT_1299452 [Collybia nuda]
MHQFSHDQILDEIHKLFDWNPPSLSLDLSTHPKLNAPSCFYYDHLDDKLSLKETILMPALTPNLSATVDRIMKTIKDHKTILPPVSVGDMFPSTEYRKAHIYDEPITDAYSVAEAYETTARHCALVASTLLLSPNSPNWRSLIKWDEIELGAGTNPGLDETHALQLKEHVKDDVINGQAWNSIEGETFSTLRRISQQSPTLALWEIFSITPDNEGLLKILGESPIPSRTTVMEGIPPASHNLHTPDALELPWGVSMSSLYDKVPASINSGVLGVGIAKDHPKRSLRFPKSAIAKNPVSLHTTLTGSKGHFEEHSRAVTLPKRTGQEKVPISEIMLKHAWLRAVRKDSTFLIFHCGTLERIAFRHRGSQTLHISGLIDVARCKYPGYGKLHIGLYMAIIYDALDRMRQLPEENGVTQVKKRRRKVNTLQSKVKRPRTRALVAKLEIDEIEHEMTCDYLTKNSTRCDLLLLRLCYGIYNSSSPSFFLRSGQPRTGKTNFRVHEYLSVTLTSEIATGATGVVHGATLKFLSGKGEVGNMTVVVKFSMKPDQQKKLRHEYSVYEELASSHVKGVPRAIGLFEDHNSDVLALVMTHTGTCLSDLYPESRFVVEEPQRSSFLRVMSDIHAAGVRHRDIRPENLTVDDDGRVYIIDFDMAETSPTNGAKSREVAHLTELLDGRYLPPNEVPSERTNPRSTSGYGSGSARSSLDSNLVTEEE